jgi:hypothetical protein
MKAYIHVTLRQKLLAGCYHLFEGREINGPYAIPLGDFVIVVSTLILVIVLSVRFSLPVLGEYDTDLVRTPELANLISTKTLPRSSAPPRRFTKRQIRLAIATSRFSPTACSAYWRTIPNCA